MKSPKALSIFVGLIAYLLCSFPFGGVAFLFVSVVCTAGVALIVWLPAFWLVGFVILSLFDLFTAVSTSDERQEAKPLDKKQMVFIQYIQKERAAGVSDQQISLAFKQVGWTDSDIQAAFKYADSVK